MRSQATAQSLAEYVTMITIVTMAFIVMFPMAKRGVQSIVRSGADQIGTQIESEQDFDSRYGHTVGSTTDAKTTTNRGITYGVNSVTTTYGDVSETQIGSTSNMGFTED